MLRTSEEEMLKISQAALSIIRFTSQVGKLNLKGWCAILLPM